MEGVVDFRLTPAKKLRFRPCKLKIIHKYVESCELNTTPKEEANHTCFDQ